MNKNNVSVVPDHTLCCSCGVCRGVCNVNAINYNIDKSGFLRPKINENCKNCGICLKCCPGASLLRDYSSPIIKSVYGYSLDNDTRLDSASGGVLTELLCFLIENSIVSYVTVVTNHKENVPKVILTNDTKIIRANKASKYCPIDYGDLIHQIEKIGGFVAIVGVPCVINSIQEYTKLNKRIGKKIKFFFSLFCNHTPSYHALDYLRENNNIVSYDAVFYRGGGWPGFFQFKLSNNLISKIPYRFAMRKGVGRYFKNVRCELCDDPFGDSADASFGDAYFCEKETLGQTLIIIRNVEISNILERMKGCQVNISVLDNLDSISKFYKKMLWRHTNTREFAYFLKAKGKNIVNLKSIEPSSPNVFSKVRYMKKMFLCNIGKHKLLWKLLYRYAN